MMEIGEFEGLKLGKPGNSQVCRFEDLKNCRFSGSRISNFREFGSSKIWQFRDS